MVYHFWTAPRGEEEGLVQEQSYFFCQDENTLSFLCHQACKKYFAEENLAKIAYKRRFYGDGI